MFISRVLEKLQKGNFMYVAEESNVKFLEKYFKIRADIVFLFLRNYVVESDRVMKPSICKLRR